jgi:DNA polymerase
VRTAVERSGQGSWKAFPTVPRRPRAPAASREWLRLSAEIRRCRKCPLGELRTHAVVYRGGRSPRVLFVGEAPGAEEDRRGLPFVGRSGRELDRAIARLGLSEEEFGIVNVLKCRPPGNRFDRAAARTCRPYLDRQLELLRPELIVTLGARALAAIDPGAPPVLSAAGRPRPGTAAPNFPLLHPAAALRSRRWRARWERDVRALAKWLAERRLVNGFNSGPAR